MKVCPCQKKNWKETDFVYLLFWTVNRFEWHHLKEILYSSLKYLRWRLLLKRIYFESVNYLELKSTYVFSTVAKYQWLNILLPANNSFKCVLKNSSSCFVTVAQGVHNRTGSTKPMRWNWTLAEQHLLQKMWPHRRQWCCNWCDIINFEINNSHWNS